jgi:hypothetical protein
VAKPARQPSPRSLSRRSNPRAGRRVLAPTHRICT